MRFPYARRLIFSCFLNVDDKEEELLEGARRLNTHAPISTIPTGSPKPIFCNIQACSLLSVGSGKGEIIRVIIGCKLNTHLGANLSKQSSGEVSDLIMS